VWLRPRLDLNGQKQPQVHGPAAGAARRVDDHDPFPATAIPVGWNGQIHDSPAWCGRRHPFGTAADAPGRAPGSWDKMSHPTLPHTGGTGTWFDAKAHL
jgi:hypothetical protein